MQINGKNFAVKYNNYAGEQIKDVKGRGNSVSGNATALVWIGYLGHCYVKQVDPEITFEELSDFLDSADDNPEAHKLLTDALSKYHKSTLYLKLVKKSAPVDTAEKKSEESNGNTLGTTFINTPGEKLALAPGSITN